MPWYAAHAIMYFQLTDGPQDQFKVYENVFLIRADSPDEAQNKARALACREEVDNDLSLRVGDRPARLVFGSIRKVVAVAHEGPDGQLGDGDEVTYSEFVVADREALDRLIGAEDVEILYLGKDAEPSTERPAQPGASTGKVDRT
jgi:hypothetical protein